MEAGGGGGGQEGRKDTKNVYYQCWSRLHFFFF